jgi:pyruvate/2-oxoglutarate/acetoin dehydrogenase E1 component
MSAPAQKTTYREAVKQAIRDALNRDPRVFVMGEDVGRYGGCYAVTKGLLQEYGEERIRDTPLSESAFVGAGIGAAMAGMRPIVEIMTVNFSMLAMDQVLNNAATIRYMSKAGTPTSPASKCWHRPRSRTRAACCGVRCRIPTRC